MVRVKLLKNKKIAFTFRFRFGFSSLLQLVKVQFCHDGHLFADKDTNFLEVVKQRYIKSISSIHFK